MLDLPTLADVAEATGVSSRTAQRIAKAMGVGAQLEPCTPLHLTHKEYRCLSREIRRRFAPPEPESGMLLIDLPARGGGRGSTHGDRLGDSDCPLGCRRLCEECARLDATHDWDEAREIIAEKAAMIPVQGVLL